MRELVVKGSRVFFWRGVTAEVGETCRALAGGTRAFLLTDENCPKSAGIAVLSLKQAGYAVSKCVLPPGEGQKTLATAARIYPAMLRADLERTSVFVAVGGGVITDLGGFVASTYMRGIPLFHVPTTLLAQVDASIGGKTAVNLPQGKNLVGTFYQPQAVFTDVMNLESLPQREFVGGLAEVIKCAMIRDPDLFRFLEDHVAAILRREAKVVEEIIYRAASVKAAVVNLDEREAGLRQILNYGHTIGHALEAATGFRGLHHGEAVSVGMEAEAFLAKELKVIAEEIPVAQRRLLHAFGLPTSVDKVSKKEVLDALAHDKKNRDGKMKFVLPESIGKVRYGIEVSPSLLSAALKTVTQ